MTLMVGISIKKLEIHTFRNCFVIAQSLQCGAPKIAKLVYNSNFTMVYRCYIKLVNGLIKPFITGGGTTLWDYHLCTPFTTATNSHEQLLGGSSTCRVRFLGQTASQFLGNR